jgi:uncharacterized membrane protein YhaH (DUF805 family)
MLKAISTCFSKYATFSGRASRSEFWYFYLFYFILYVASLVITAGTEGSFLPLIVVLVLFLPLLAAAVRRLHDTDRSGWFYLVPIYNIILLIQKGTPGENRFGSPEN